MSVPAELLTALDAIRALRREDREAHREAAWWKRHGHRRRFAEALAEEREARGIPTGIPMLEVFEDD